MKPGAHGQHFLLFGVHVLKIFHSKVIRGGMKSQTSVVGSVAYLRIWYLVNNSENFASFQITSIFLRFFGIDPDISILLLRLLHHRLAFPHFLSTFVLLFLDLLSIVILLSMKTLKYYIFEIFHHIDFVIFEL